MNGIIDFHTHPFIDCADNLCMYKDSVRMDCNDFLNDIKSVGITTFCGSVIHRELKGFDTLRKSNRDALKLKEIYGDAYIPGIHVHPEFIEDSKHEVEFAVENNIKIIGERVPYMHGWLDYACEEFSEILDYIGNYSLIVSLHTMDQEQMRQMAEKHRNVKFVFAHPGERANVDKHIEIIKNTDNVYLDISGTGLFRYGVLRHLADEVGAEKILFGTDYPIGNLSMYINGVLGEKLSEKERNRILYENAAELLKL